ncbi:hypothetical protein HDC92_004338 [Pedobacter sp. AK017]|uniref:hypothetical protein n=1 Tax=Pedobacter sp. AK017 TaxID=2723073 RepID=UPI0016106A91|nr:hypothetical protein [Pedobacter sp. AK017]MBB5440635.1 hypothetical protein [Pedobacter sp. AK017]
MSKEIKSLADELREAMRGSPENDIKPKAAERPPPQQKVKVKPLQTSKTQDHASLESLFTRIKAHKLGDEKLLIRLQPNTIKLLKQLKIDQSIDMNKFISFALHDFLKGNPALITYIKDSLNQFDL